MYKAQGARATEPGKDQGEANAPFADNKLSSFFSAVNGVKPICAIIGINEANIAGMAAV